MPGKGIPETLRQYAVEQGRCMVRVRSLKTHELATIGVCPACFNNKQRRQALLIKLEKMGYEVVHGEDRLDGFYRPGRQHAPGCRYGHPSTDAWDEFARIMKTRKKK